MERKQIPISQIEANKFNPNMMTPEEFNVLLEDMKKAGPKNTVRIDRIVVAPKNVFYNNPDFKADEYVIIDGENRWRAAKQLKWKTIDCEIQNIGEHDGRIICYRRNKERGSIDPLKEASLFKLEVDKGLKHDYIARMYNVSRTYVGHTLKLLQLDSKVVEMYREPEESFKKAVLEEHEKRVEEWEEQVKKPGMEWMQAREIEAPDPEELVPRGTITPSHLEALSTLPEEKQVDLATSVLNQDMSVRETERRVKRAKEDIAEEKRFKAALEKAKRKKCPQCGGDPKGFSYSDETRFKCDGGSSNCYNTWEFMKTRKEVEAEKKRAKTAADKQVADRMREGRENPKYIRLPDTPEELHEKVKPWLLQKIQQLTEVHRVKVYGLRGEEVVELDYTPPAHGLQRMDLTFKVGKQLFGFNVQTKDYKKVDAKCRVDMDWNMKPGEETREALRQFFSETVKTDKDPKLVKA